MVEVIRFQPKMHEYHGYCSFCFTPADVAKRMLSGGVPGKEVFVCGECVKSMAELVKPDEADQCS